MDYFDLLKRAWNITWRYKALWVLGLFAGVASGSSGGSPGGNSNYSEGGDEMAAQWDRFASWATENIALIAVVAAGLVVISVALWILSIAAQGGIAHGTNEAAAGRTPSLRESWSAGFAKWGRTFMVQFVLGLPVFLVALLIAGVVAAAVIGGGDSAAGVGAICLVVPVLAAVVIGASLIIGILLPVALRYGVLLDVTYGQAIKRAWDDLWAKKGLFVFWLVMLLPGIAYGFVVFAFVLVGLVPAFLAMLAEQYVIAGALFVVIMLALMLPGAVYSTFVNAAWTLMFRHLTGMDPSAAVQAAAPAIPSEWTAPSAPTDWNAPPAPPAPSELTPPAPTPPPPPGSDVE